MNVVKIGKSPIMGKVQSLLCQIQAEVPSKHRQEVDKKVHRMWHAVYELYIIMEVCVT